jgi:hypothetical protein
MAESPRTLARSAKWYLSQGRNTFAIVKLIISDENLFLFC